MRYLFSLLICISLVHVVFAYSPDVDCPEGTYTVVDEMTQATTCEDCLLGYYQPTRGQSSCIPCEVGRYQDEEGKENCKECPLGTTTNGEGSASADACRSTDKVPAMNRWGLILLIGAVLGAAIFLLGRSGLSKE